MTYSSAVSHSLEQLAFHLCPLVPTFSKAFSPDSVPSRVPALRELPVWSGSEPTHSFNHLQAASPCPVLKVKSVEMSKSKA